MKQNAPEFRIARGPSRAASGQGLEVSTQMINALERGRYDLSPLLRLHNGPSPGPSNEALFPPPN